MDPVEDLAHKLHHAATWLVGAGFVAGLVSGLIIAGVTEWLLSIGWAG